MQRFITAKVASLAAVACALLAGPGCGASSHTEPTPTTCHVNEGSSYVVTFGVETTGHRGCPDYTNFETANCTNLPLGSFPPAWTFIADGSTLTESSSCVVGTQSSGAYDAKTCAATLDWNDSTLLGCPAVVQENITFDENAQFTGTMQITSTCAADAGPDAGPSLVCTYPITSIQPQG